ncbi:MAG: ribosome silencing factor [Pirellulales bacterium]|nr:ribosome silencing factor [Pirellulales bacterium]
MSLSSHPEQSVGLADHSRQLALLAAKIADDNRAREILILDLREVTSVFDFFVIASGSSIRQLHAIADDIEKGVAETLGEKKLGIEGYSTGGWCLIDFGDVVVHLFDDASREYYGLEELWGNARRLEFGSLNVVGS